MREGTTGPPCIDAAKANDAMLHALLHHKLDETTPAPRRIEDAVTSTVFGTLLLAGADDALAGWMSSASGPSADQAPIDGPVKAAWFWPRLALAEPDVVLQFDDRVVIVEAKVGSDRHDLDTGREAGAEDWTTISNQLCRQWLCAASPTPGPACPADLAAAFRSLPLTLVFLVDERRLPRATPQFDETLKQLPAGADLRLLTWQALHRDLMRAGREEDRAFWRTALIEYFRLVGLAGFVGVRELPLPSEADLGAVIRHRWAPAPRAGARWTPLDPIVFGVPTHALMNWSLRAGATRPALGARSAGDGRALRRSPRVPDQSTTTVPEEDSE